MNPFIASLLRIKQRSREELDGDYEGWLVSESGKCANPVDTHKHFPTATFNAQSAFVFSVLINMELILIKKKNEDIFHYLEVKRVFNGYILL